MLDGDDWLYDRNVLSTIDFYYRNGYNYTYGSYYSYIDSKVDYYLQPKQNNDIQYNRHFSPWFCQHLRTMRSHLIKDIPLKNLQIHNRWIKCGSDMAESYFVLEKSETKHIKIDKPTYIYNRDNSIRYPMSYYNKDYTEYKMYINNYIKKINE
jgi:hypothetical protein